MKKKVEIILRSVQRNEEEENETELRTEGVYEHDGKNWSVSYEESEATGFEDSTTEITGTEGRCVSIVRRGSANSNLMIETGKKHYCLYGTPFGDMTLGRQSESAGRSVVSAVYAGCQCVFLIR